jgi:hypothetical protein
METIKAAVVKAMQELPEDASIDDALEKLFFLRSMERSLGDIRTGKTISNEEAMKRVEKWLS